ncbi:MAG TPA: hypothetical protein VNQ90_07325 [Chthoniobacteraceae bacterium]|nr:hypothetical protein [Chthoniobacteraceae bacterium]
MKTAITLPSFKAVATGAASLFAIASFATGQTVTVPTPLLFWDFNSSTGNTVASTGSETMDLTMYRPDPDVPSTRQEANMLGGAGSGVSGAAGDRALDFSGATGMGKDNGYGGAAVGGYLADVPGFDGAISMTIAGWYYTTKIQIGGDAQIINMSDAQKGGFRLVGQSGGGRLGVYNFVGSPPEGGGTNRYVASFFSSSSPRNYSAVGEWVFFAFTIDSSGTDTVMSYYYGSADGEVKLDSTTSVANIGGHTASFTKDLTLGNYSGNGTTYPFQGLMDNIGLWASTTNGSGALTLQQLEALRVSQIPEPGAGALIGAAGLLLLGRALASRRKPGARPAV